MVYRQTVENFMTKNTYLTEVIFIKNSVECINDFLAEKGNTITIAELANVYESIWNMILRLNECEDFDGKTEIVNVLRLTYDRMSTAPFFSIVNEVSYNLNVVGELANRYFKNC